MENKQTIQITANKKEMHYAVMCTMFKNDAFNTLKYEMSIKYLEGEINNHFLCEVDKTSKTFINDEEVNELADELAEKTTSCIYPLKLIVNKMGIWEDVYNSEEIKSRWAKNKQNLLQVYQGKFVKQYFDQFEKKLAHKEALKLALQKDFFLSSFFVGLYTTTADKKQNFRKVHFPLLHTQESLAYDVLQEHFKKDVSANTIKIERQGNIIDQNEVNSTSSLSNQQILSKGGFYKSTHFLNADDHHISAAIVESGVKYDDAIKVQVLIAAIDKEKDKLENNKIGKL
jgi:hypothetical protein